ncbi:pilus assembly protein PilM [Patescibacteria group bacterium]
MSWLHKDNSLGVSLSHRAIEMLEAEHQPDGRMILRSLSEALLEEGVFNHTKVLDIDRLAAALEKVHQAAAPKRFSTNELHIALPDSVTYFHVFRFPGSLNDKEVENALSFQIEEVIPVPLKDLRSDFAVVSRESDQTIILYAAVLKEVVEQIEKAVVRAGLKVGSIGLESEALARVLLGESNDHASLIVDIGERTTTFIVRDRLGLRFIFNSDTAGGDLTEAVMTLKNIPKKKAEAIKQKIGVEKSKDVRVSRVLIRQVAKLAERIVEVIDWVEAKEGCSPLSEVVLTGGTSEMPGIIPELEKHLTQERPKLNVRHGDAFEHVADSPLITKLKKNHMASQFAPALGMLFLGPEEQRRFKLVLGESEKEDVEKGFRWKELAGIVFFGIAIGTFVAAMIVI